MIGSPYLSGLHNGQNATMFTLDKVPIIVLLLAHANDDVFEKEDSSSFWSPQAFLRHISLFWTEEPDKALAPNDLSQKVKNHFSLFTVH